MALVGIITSLLQLVSIAGLCVILLFILMVACNLILVAISWLTQWYYDLKLKVFLGKRNKG